MIYTEKIKEFFIKNYKLILFLLIFFCVCFVYNINNPTLNYILKRGILLEYSIPNYDTKTKDSLKELNFKYLDSQIFKLDKKDYDFENDPYENVLFVQIPMLADKKTEAEINKISDVVFKNNENSKLINVSALGSDYNQPYSAFLKFLGILFVSLVIFYISLYLFFNKEFSKEKIKKSVIGFCEKRK